MPSQPKKIQRPDASQIPITLGEPDVHQLCECADIDWKKSPERAEHLKLSVEKHLSIHFNMLRRQAMRPSPAQMARQLQQIAKHASELANLLDPYRLPVQLERELGIPEVDDGHAMLLIQHIAMSASLAVDRLSEQDSSGFHVKRFGEALACVRAGLEGLFAGLRPPNPEDSPEEYEDARDEFVDVCRRRLPQPPTARKKRVATPAE